MAVGGAVGSRSGEAVNLERFAAHLASNYVPNSVIIDTTASEVPPHHYLEWMKAGIHIITPNKKLNSGPLPQYLALRQFQRESYIHYFYEVGCPCPSAPRPSAFAEDGWPGPPPLPCCWAHMLCSAAEA